MCIPVRYLSLSLVLVLTACHGKSTMIEERTDETHAQVADLAAQLAQKAYVGEPVGEPLVASTEALSTFAGIPSERLDPADDHTEVYAELIRLKDERDKLRTMEKAKARASETELITARKQIAAFQEIAKLRPIVTVVWYAIFGLIGILGALITVYQVGVRYGIGKSVRGLILGIGTGIATLVTGTAWYFWGRTVIMWGIAAVIVSLVVLAIRYYLRTEAFAELVKKVQDARIDDAGFKAAFKKKIELTGRAATEVNRLKTSMKI